MIFNELDDPPLTIRFYPLKEECSREVESTLVEQKLQADRLVSEDFGQTGIGRLRKTCWNITEYPETSLAARVK